MTAQVPDPPARASDALQRKLGAAEEEVACLRRDLAEARAELAESRESEAEGLARETATSDILRVIASSPTDLGAVLDAVGERAARLCECDNVSIFRVEGELLRKATDDGVPAGVGVGGTIPITPETASGRAVLDRRTIHLRDLLGEEGAGFALARSVQAGRVRTILATPLLREGAPIGAIVVRRSEVRPFTDQQIKLLETFADQAVIAIENARLFHELQEANRQLGDANGQLEIASQHKSQFLANMSHELRTPLNAIIGFSEVLVERMFGEVNEKQEEYLRDILTSGQHLLSLINDILDLSKVEAGRMELELGEFSLPEALENGLTMLKERASRHGIALGLHMDPDLDVIEADERKVKQVVFNLLSNAVKFTPDGGRVELSARSADGEVLIAVRDTGVGIAPEEQAHVFEEFRQTGAGRAQSEGTGLGLPLAKRFAELHGGQMWVESAVGVGSTFTFTLPKPRAVHKTEALH